MKRTILILLSLVLLEPVLGADSVREIMDRADKPFLGTQIYTRSEMTVHRSGQARPTLEMESYSMRDGDRELSLSLYLGPARMKGTAYLMIDDDLWVRFASTGRIRKLSSSAKKHSAGGTDFSYYDMADSGQGFTEEYSLQLDDEQAAVDGQRCYRIVLLPEADSDIPYDKVLCYVGREDYRYLQLEYYEDGAHIKTLRFSDYRDVNGRSYPFRYEMESHTHSSRTEVVVKAVEFDSSRVGLEMFSVPYLRRIQ